MTRLILSNLILALALACASESAAGEFSGYLTAEGRAFTDDALYSGQERNNVSLAAEPEYYHEWENGSSFTFTPFARVDSADPERSHFDIRELNYLWLADRWEVRVGISKVFWGVTESQHLVDIINQTDLVENTDGEDKLGQPMIHLSIPRDSGVVDMFILPYFRERTFPGEEGRLRAPLVVDSKQAIYESSAEERRVDAAIRYSHTIGNWDLGLSHFHGTNREPTLLAGTDNAGEPVLTPYYELIDQTGFDLQLVAGQWLWKLESIYRRGQADDDFFASTGGFEYTFTGITSQKMDIGLLCEWLYDDRGKEATTAYDDDIMIGTRMALNDAQSTEALMGIIRDVDGTGTVFWLETSRRIGSSWKLSIESFFVLDSSDEDPVHVYRDDDHLRIELSYYF